MKVGPTYLLIVANLSVYVITSIVGSNMLVAKPEVLFFFGQVNFLVMQGWFWQLITAMFIHVNIAHIASNMLFLLVFGLKGEELFKAKEFYLIYFAAGLAGNLLTLLAGPYTFYASAGASGAIFGLPGANTIYLRVILRQPVTTP
jgi:rhomboid protease GluP